MRAVFKVYHPETATSWRAQLTKLEQFDRARDQYSAILAVLTGGELRQDIFWMNLYHDTSPERGWCPTWTT